MELLVVVVVGRIEEGRRCEAGGGEEDLGGEGRRWVAVEGFGKGIG